MRKGDHANWLINDRLRGFNLISKSYFLALHKAKKEIIILNSYFWPGIKLIQELRAAGDRGVSIKLILPALSDSIIFRNATRYFYKVRSEERRVGKECVSTSRSRWWPE